MAFYDKTTACCHREKPDLPSKNRVVVFSAISAHRARSFSPQPLAPHREKRPTPTKSTSGLSCWLARDLVADIAGPNTYLFLGNDCVNRLDAHGLLTFEKNECQGCNAGFGIPGVSYWHEPTQTCRDSSLGTYVAGSGGGFAHSCGENHSWQTGGLCDTETHIFIRASNDLCCCRTWLVRCQWEYVGSAMGPDSAEITMKPSFLGRQVAHLLDKDPAHSRSPHSRSPHPPPYSASVGPRSGIEYGVLNIPCGGTRDVFRMEAVIRVNGGYVSEIREECIR